MYFYKTSCFFSQCLQIYTNKWSHFSYSSQIMSHFGKFEVKLFVDRNQETITAKLQKKVLLASLNLLNCLMQEGRTRSEQCCHTLLLVAKGCHAMSHSVNF